MEDDADSMKRKLVDEEKRATTVSTQSEIDQQRPACELIKVLTEIPEDLLKQVSPRSVKL